MTLLGGSLLGSRFNQNDVDNAVEYSNNANNSRYGSYEMLTPPNHELKKVPIKVYRNSGFIYTNFNPSDWEPVSFDATYHVSQSFGDPANGGLSMADALNQLDDALDLIIAHAGVNFELIIYDGYFDRLTGWRGRQIGSKNIVVRCLGDVTSSAEYSGLSWSDEGGGMWSASRSATGVVYDKINLTSDGEWTQLIPVNTLTDCQNTSGSAYTDGATIYIHRSDDLQPTDTNTMVGTTTINVRPAEDGTTVIYGMKMYGGPDAISCNMGSNVNSNVILVNCKSGYTQTNAADFNGAKVAISYNHTCVGAGNDGFNYQAGASGLQQLAAEINCTGRGFGRYSGDDNNNASSMHDNGKIIRVGCNYDDSLGPVVIDVNNAISWNVNCKSGATFGVAGTLSASWAAGVGATMYLDSCVATGGSEFDAVGTGDIFVRNSPTIANTSGNVSSY